MFTIEYYQYESAVFVLANHFESTTQTAREIQLHP
ncbi:MAG: hypothetical protein J07HQW1_01026 [Haloquadratum walsbyi J07HQW1]|uniref:Uncharacterized protein n=1 Tax=Haloquadratum walsbyi J07HQW1 TaxID=1238424 RepID=U1N392_9EURY|nr:MAG: hypothetical protein J07HQW1_01026 [Haloquadratum walsbyi J07HQW1]